MRQRGVYAFFAFGAFGAFGGTMASFAALAIRNFTTLRVPLCKSFRLMPPSWFLRFWTDQAYLGCISRGLRVWRHLREIPGGYCGGHWPRPVRRGPALAERSVSTSRRIARPAWVSSRRGSEAIPGR